MLKFLVVYFHSYKACTSKLIQGSCFVFIIVLALALCNRALGGALVWGQRSKSKMMKMFVVYFFQGVQFYVGTPGQIV